MPTVSSILKDYASLSVPDQNAVKTAIVSAVGVSTDMETFVADERFKSGFICPFCGKEHIVRHGKHDGKQRYRCKDCGRTFFATSNSIASGTHKDIQTWELYIDCMMNGYSLRKTAKICHIHYNTAFVWRHKILDALQLMADDVVLDGMVEADETFFDISYKGNHSKSKTFSMPRKPHKRGHQVKVKGISHEKVCVPCAVNRNGLSIAKATNLGRVSTKDLHTIYDNRIKEGSTVITDKLNSYKRLCKANGLELVQLKSGKSKNGIYHIQHINNYHSQLKLFIARFKGVSSKYINNYLIWHNLVDYAKQEWAEKKMIFLGFVLTTILSEKYNSIPKRCALPI